MIEPRFVILGGANGAGKSTLAQKYIPDLIANGTFLNADDVARELQPDNAEAAAARAGREVIRQRDELISSGKSFCIETTLASRTLLSLIGRANKASYITRLIFLFTPTPQINEFRVKQRVMRGGHNIDTDTIRRRHMGGLRLLPEYIQACREAIVLDARTSSTREILHKERGVLTVVDHPRLALLKNSIQSAGGTPLF